uniref:hypothetical protein n=1 Tax=Ningiella ruwaisensis TaxID=2364274 RepID=UPI00109FAA49|nr:hypothetical protein [Ningiella ruwaisensis]
MNKLFDISKQDSRWALASLLLVVCFVFLGEIIVELRHLPEASPEMEYQLQESFEEADQEPTALALNYQVQSNPPQSKLSLFSNFELPPAPFIVRPAASNPLASEPSIQGSEQYDDPTITEIINARASQVSRYEKSSATTIYAESEQKNASEHVDKIEASLHKANMTIHLPENPYEREKIYRVLYECVGVGLASVNKRGEGIEASYELMPLSALPKQKSKLLRNLSGIISNKEQQLKAAYAPRSRVVRVYPASFDRLLSMFIAHHLQDEPLKHLSARYALVGRQLRIRDIRLNNSFIDGEWTLYNGLSHACVI